MLASDSVAQLMYKVQSPPDEQIVEKTNLTAQDFMVRYAPLSSQSSVAVDSGINAPCGKRNIIYARAFRSWGKLVFDNEHTNAQMTIVANHDGRCSRHKTLTELHIRLGDIDDILHTDLGVSKS